MSTTVYEQPANELLRTCLRLEHLFTQLDYHYQNCVSLYHVRITVRLILEIVNILDRPDLKSKLTQEFHRIKSIFDKLESTPEISQEQLDKKRQDIQASLNYLTSIYGKLAQQLKQNHFLSNILGHLSASGGDSPFETPAYHCWLQQSRQEQNNQLTQWLDTIIPVRQAINLLLNIIRNSTYFSSIEAYRGCYHCPLPTYPPIQLVRIEVDDYLLRYPEISVGRHRLNVCFYELNLNDRPEQVENNFTFKLALCKI